MNTSATFDAASQLTTLAHGGLASFGYGLDDNGNRTSLNESLTLTGGTVQSGSHNFG